MTANRKIRPWWVKFALWGLPNRAAGWLSFWVAALLGSAFLIGGFWQTRLFAGTILFVAAAWYWAALVWVDRHDPW
jgi:hypothetical protein